MDKKELAKQYRDQLNLWNHEYHTLGDPTVPDAEYDRVYDLLEVMENEFPELIELDSPSQRVGASVKTEFVKVEHAVPMLSLNKVHGETGLHEWIDNTKTVAQLHVELLEVKTMAAQIMAKLKEAHFKNKALEKEIEELKLNIIEQNQNTENEAGKGLQPS